MKKLMTMLAAVGLSFGLFAETTFPNGTSFESNMAGDNTVELLNAQETGASWAASADASATLTVTDYIAAGQTPITAEAKRPAQFAMATQYNFLEIKSAFDKPFVRTLETALTKGAAGYYVDTLVRFTLADDTIEVSDASAKLAVYVKAIDAEGNEDGQTNLVVVANKVDAQGQKTVTHFDCRCDADVADGKWHRLTIKAIDDITNGDDVPGFVVFVDNEIVSSKTETPIASAVKDEVSVWANNKQLFCSLYPSSATITGLAVAGQGGIDDISFTQDVPFAAARDYGKLTVDFSADKEKIATFTATVSGSAVEATAAQIAAGSMVIPLQGELPSTISIAWTAQPGFKSGSDAVAVDDGVATVPGGTVKGLVAKFEEEYDNLQAAVTAANTSATNGTLTLLADEVTGNVAIDNRAKGTTITLDLNGKTLTGAVSLVMGSKLVIDDSATGGKVTGDFALLPAGSFQINAGTFDGALTTLEAYPKCIYGGAFKNDPSTYLADGKKAVLDQADNYYKITDKVPVTAVEINKEALELAVDGTETLTYTVTPDGADVDTAVWSSDNMAVATVDPASGLVTAIAAGTATITITVNGTITDTCAVTVKASEITITATLGEGIDSATIDGKPVASGEAIKLAAGTESVPVVLTANSGIKIPVFYCQKGVTSPVKKDASFTLDIEDGDTYYFTAKDAKDVDPTDAKEALEAKGVESATTAKFPGESVKNLATWMEAKGMTDEAGIEAINGSDYVQASVALDVALITEQTAVAVESQTFAATGSALTFKVEIAGVVITTDNVADFVKTTNDVANWDKDGTGITVSALDGVVTVDGGSNTAVFSKIVIPVDKTPNVE